MARQGPFRLNSGGSIDRSRAVSFRFNRTAYSGHAGDTLASALLANGVRTVARSFKFHRPRGIFSCGVEEPNALLQLWSGALAVPSARATMVELSEGLEAFAQAGWPGLTFDAGRLLDFTGTLWAAGFYNKTFIWPNWHTYEGLVRRMAGLGRAPAERDPDRYDVHNVHCDVLVIGGGVAGLSAALAAGRKGARVVLVEQHASLGGRCAWDGSSIGDVSAAAWVAGAAEQLRGLPDTKVFTRTTAVGCYDHDVVTLHERVHPPRTGGRSGHGGTPRERYWVVRAARTVLATGEMEQPLVFCNNDRPGIMLAGAAREYARRYGVAPGRRVLVATNNDSAYAAARDLRNAGVEVLGIADTRSSISVELSAEMKSLSIPVLAGSMPTDTRGFGALRGVVIGRLSSDLRKIGSVRSFSCDALVVSGGWSPTLHLYAQAGGKLVYDDASRALQPLAGRVSSMSLVGSAARFHVPAAAVRHAAAAGETAAAEALNERGAGATPVEVPPRVLDDIGVRASPVGNTRRQWVDLLHDVTVSDLELALREHYTSVEHVKRYTTVGMAADQGKTSSAATLEILGGLRNMPPAGLGHTTLRPPFTPVTMGAIAGRELGERFSPGRLLPIHDWHAAHGAILQDFGEWRRPVAYLQSGETRASSCAREVRLVRTAAGLFDGSPLGKLEVQGPDAMEFLDRFYINPLTTLQPGRTRYGLMLLDSGVILDDGTIVMLEPDHFLVTTTSGNAGRVASWMEEWRQCEWPHLRVAITPVTDAWAMFALTGPRAREILGRLDGDIDLSKAAFAHLGMRAGHLAGVPVRVYRVSFSGELTYEINVPTGQAQTLWDALMRAGAPYGLQPFGLDALLSMRLEKGFLHIGTETDGTTVPDDVGWGRVAARKASDFIGKRSLALPENVRPDRLQLVGLEGTDGAQMHPGSHVKLPDSTQPTDGWVTSAGNASLSGTPIALAMLRGGRSRTGTLLTVHDLGLVTQARVVELPFLDPSGERMNA